MAKSVFSTQCELAYSSSQQPTSPLTASVWKVRSPRLRNFKYLILDQTAMFLVFLGLILLILCYTLFKTNCLVRSIITMETLVNSLSRPLERQGEGCLSKVKPLPGRGHPHDTAKGLFLDPRSIWCIPLPCRRDTLKPLLFSWILARQKHSFVRTPRFPGMVPTHIFYVVSSSALLCATCVYSCLERFL